MAETYTGNEGTEAAAAGMDVLDGTEDRRTGWLAINKTRDYLAAKLAAINWSSLVGKPTSFPNDDVTEATASATEGALVRYGTGGRINVGAPGTAAANAATKGYVDDRVGSIDAGVPASGGTFTGQVYFPNSTPASSGYTVAYINSDGRLAKGASSERYKSDIDRAPVIPNVFVVPIAAYTLTADPDHVTRYGPIAEDLAANPATAELVVYDVEGRIESFDMISYLHAAVANLNARVEELETP